MNNILKKIIWVVFMVPTAYLAIIWNNIPDIVPLHSDLKGNIDKYGSKNELLVLAGVLTAVNVITYFILCNIYRIDPKKYASENKGRLQKLAFAVSVFIAGVLCLVIYGTTHPSKGFNLRLLLGGAGLLFCIIGNYMANLKPNYFAGLRLPWTLESEKNWRATHHFAGRLWFAGGLAMAVVCLLVPQRVAFILFYCFIMLLVLIPVIYSFRFYRKEKKGVT